MSLKDKRILVIGGGSGIGKAVAGKALAEGASLVDFVPSMFTSLVDLNFEEAKKMLNVRYWGALAVAKHAAKILPPGGSFTFTDGLLAHRPMKGSVLAT